MDANRFDTISKLFAHRRTRRSAIAGGVGLAAASVGSRAFAQDGTPEVATPVVDPNDPHPSADDARPKTEFLFVQPFDAGTWAPKDGEDGVYTLTLTGAAANTVYFSDRPERIVGLAPTGQFLDGLGFTPENPPNAAIVAPREDGEGQEILVIELLAPRYDTDAGTLTYDARVLADYGKHGLAHLARQQDDYALVESFGPGSLFIDDCSTLHIECSNALGSESFGYVVYPLCWNAEQNACESCSGHTNYNDVCAEAWPSECAGGCSVNLCVLDDEHAPNPCSGPCKAPVGGSC